jgi:RHS repeat-associated protein
LDYAIPDLYLAASSESKTKLLTGFKAAPFVEPATGLAYFRARWYDPSTGTFLTPDPMGYQDSSNLYAAFGNDPVNNSDPLGMSFVNDYVDQFVIPYAKWFAGKSPTLASAVGWGIGVYESALEMGYSGTLPGQVEMISGIAQAYYSAMREGYRQDGALGVVAGGAEVWANTVQGIMLGLPVVNTIRQIAAIPEAYDAGSFEGGRQVGRATFSLGLDATLAYGVYRGVTGSASSPPGSRAALIEANRARSASLRAKYGRISIDVINERIAARTVEARLVRVAKSAFKYEVEQLSGQPGMGRARMGKIAEVRATRTLRRWAERQGIQLGEGGLRFQVRGESSVPDVVYDPGRLIIDFKLTPKAIRWQQSVAFRHDFPGYNSTYVFGTE